MATIQGIYLALFGRPADPAGLAYFNSATDFGIDLTAIGDLADTAEYQDRFAGMNDAQIVTSIFQTIYERNPDQAGLDFYVGLLESGAQDINTIAIHILNGAQGADLNTLNNKLAAASLFTTSLDNQTEIGAYVGDNAANIGRQFLDNITSDTNTVPNQTEADTAIQLLLPPQQGQGPDDGGSPDNPGGGSGGSTGQEYNFVTDGSNETITNWSVKDLINVDREGYGYNEDPIEYAENDTQVFATKQEAMNWADAAENGDGDVAVAFYDDGAGGTNAVVAVDGDVDGSYVDLWIDIAGVSSNEISASNFNLFDTYNNLV